MSDNNLPETEQRTDIETETTPDNPLDAVGKEMVVGTETGDTDPKEMELASDDNALAQAAGTTGAIERGVNVRKLNEILADDMYGDESNTLRELAQNAETACIEACRLYLMEHSDYGREWLQRQLWVDAETGETITDAAEYGPQEVCDEFDLEPPDITLVSLNKGLSTIVEAARDIGYDPTIEVEVHHDERMVVVEDNGIGMTAKELLDGFNTTFESGSGKMGDTGGMWGAGVMTIGAWMGLDSGGTLFSKTRKRNVSEDDKRGHKAYVYVGGLNPMDPDPDDPHLDDDWYGTRLEIPILPEAEDGPDLDKFSGWADDTLAGLRVPVQYREFRNGECIEKEEYGGDPIWKEVLPSDDPEEPPVLIERPGEFTAFAGPTVEDHIGYQSYSEPDEPDTWLVSMPIGRNTSASVKSFWDVGIQIHDEQKICVAGPHRGMRKANIDDVHDDDVFTPKPTTDRDRLQDDDEAKAFFEYVSEVVQEREMENVADVFEKMLAADHPADVVRESPNDWNLFKRMVNYHSRNATSNENRFKKFLKNQDGLPDVHVRYNDDDQPVAGPKHPEEAAIEQIYELFTTVQYAPSDMSHSRATQKSSRSSESIGDILVDAPPEQMFMAASTSGAFEERRRVVENTFDEWGTVIVEAHRYDHYADIVGFRKLKDVPRTESDDHEFDVPDDIHQRTQKKSTSTTQGQSKPDTIEDRTLKIRHDSSNKTVDDRHTIEEVRDDMAGGDYYGYNDPLILFPGGKNYPNISDHYDMQQYGAIASCTQEEYEALADLSEVYTLSEYMAASMNTVIATEKGGRRVRNLVQEGEMLVLLYAQTNSNRKEVKRLLAEENREVLELLREDLYETLDVQDRRVPVTERDESDRFELVFGVIDGVTMKQAGYGFELLQGSEPNHHRQNQMAVLATFSHGTPMSWPWTTHRVRNLDKLRRYAEKEHWRARAPVFDKYSPGSDSPFQEVLEGFHDIGVDPTLLTAGEIRRLIADNIDPEDCHYYGDKPTPDDEAAAGEPSLEERAAERQAMLFTADDD